jgi:hypothetical protein
MPNVRHTPKRRRATCPGCGRDISYTTLYFRSNESVAAMVYGDKKIFARHKAPDGTECSGKKAL